VLNLRQAGAGTHPWIRDETVQKGILTRRVILGFYSWVSLMATRGSILYTLEFGRLVSFLAIEPVDQLKRGMNIALVCHRLASELISDTLPPPEYCN